jgi:outer membrane protein assembly factor BamB
MMKYFLRILLLVGFLSVLAGCEKDNTPPPTPLSKMAPDAIQVNTLWSISATNGSDDKYFTIGSGLSSNILVSAGVNGGVTAVNADKGEELWHISLPNAVSATPALNDTQIFVTTLDGHLYALNQKDGSVQWKVSLPSSVLGAPAATDDVVVVHCHDASVEAYAAQDGHVLWTYNGNAPLLTLYAGSSPLIYNGNVYVGFANGQLAAFDLYQGHEIWQAPVALPSSPDAVSSMVDITANPIEDNNAIFTVAYHGNLMAISVTNGSVLWAQEVSSFETPAIGSVRVAVTDETGRVIVYDEASGQELWEQKDFLYRFISPPAILNNWVIVGDYDGYVHFMSLNDGSPLARIHVSSAGIRAQPIIYGNTIIITTESGRIVALQVQGS